MRSHIFRSTTDLICRTAVNQKIFKLMRQRVATVHKLTKLGSLIKLSKSKVTHHMMKTLAVLTWTTGVKFGITMQRRGYKHKFKLNKAYQYKNIPSDNFIAYVKKQLKKTKSKVSEKSMQQSVRSYGLIIWLFAVNYGQNFVNYINKPLNSILLDSNFLLNKRKSLFHFKRKKWQKYRFEDGYRKPFPVINEDVMDDTKSYCYKIPGLRKSLSTIQEVTEKDSIDTLQSTNIDNGTLIQNRSTEDSLWSQNISDVSSMYKPFHLIKSSDSSINLLLNSSKQEKSSKNLLDNISKTIDHLMKEHLYIETLCNNIVNSQEITYVKNKTESTQTANLNLVNEFVTIQNVSMFLEYFEKHVSLLRSNFENCLELLKKQSDKKFKNFDLKDIDNMCTEQKVKLDQLELNQKFESDYFSKLCIFSNLSSIDKESKTTVDSESNLLPNMNFSDVNNLITTSDDTVQDFHCLKVPENFVKETSYDLNVLYKSNEFNTKEYNSISQFKQISKNSLMLSNMLLNSNNNEKEMEKTEMLKVMFADLIQDQIELTKVANKIIKSQADEIQELINKSQTNHNTEFDKDKLLKDNNTSQKLIETMNYFDEKLSKINSNLDLYDDSNGKYSFSKSNLKNNNQVSNYMTKNINSHNQFKTEACQVDFMTRESVASNHNTEKCNKVFENYKNKDREFRNKNKFSYDEAKTSNLLKVRCSNVYTQTFKNILVHDLDFKSDGTSNIYTFMHDVWYSTLLFMGIIFMTFIFLMVLKDQI